MPHARPVMLIENPVLWALPEVPVPVVILRDCDPARKFVVSAEIEPVSELVHPCPVANDVTTV